MRIKLRPYHPTYVVGFFGMGGMNEGFNKAGFNEVIAQIREDPDIEVELVEEYDDICENCDRREAPHQQKGNTLWTPFRQHHRPTRSFCSTARI